jgi:DNA polymerase-3 subunit epsilon
LQPVYTFSLLLEGQNLLRKLVREYRLCPKLCFIQRDNDPCIGLSTQDCDGACEQRESPESYNGRIEAAIAALVKSFPSFTLMDEGRHPDEKSCILVEQGRLYGMGYLPTDVSIGDAEELKNYLTRYPENDYMRGLIYQHAEKWPGKKINLVV